MRAEAIIPARGGSKRIPGKNIRPFCGKPIIAWSIEAALQSGVFESVHVSTDCPEIAAVSRDFGASVAEPLRPASLGGDRTLLLDVMQYEAESRRDRASIPDPDALCFILATAPMISTSALQQGVSLMQSELWDYALAATSFPAPLHRAFRQVENGGTEMLVDNAYEMFSNDLDEAYHDAGQFYWGRFEKWLQPTPGFFGARTTIIHRPRHLCQDIDTEDDWRRAEALFDWSRRESEF